MNKLAIVLERQLSYFATEDGLRGLLEYLGEDHPWCEIFQMIDSSLSEKNSREPFELWEREDRRLDADFKDLIAGLTNFDPTKRLTAQQALAHMWFSDS